MTLSAGESAAEFGDARLDVAIADEGILEAIIVVVEEEPAEAQKAQVRLPEPRLKGQVGELLGCTLDEAGERFAGEPVQPDFGESTDGGMGIRAGPEARARFPDLGVWILDWALNRAPESATASIAWTTQEALQISWAGSGLPGSPQAVSTTDRPGKQGSGTPWNSGRQVPHLGIRSARPSCDWPGPGSARAPSCSR